MSTRRSRKPGGPQERPSQTAEWHTGEHQGYRIQCLRPYQRFRGTEMPWDKLADLLRMTEEVTKSSRSRKVVKLAAGHFGTPLELFVKRYNFKTWYGPYLRMTRRSRAREEFELGWVLKDAGIRTPTPVWVAEQMGTPSRYSMLATEAIPAAENIWERWMRLDEEECRLDLMRAVGHFLLLLHERGFYHDDCKSGHVLVRLDSPSDPREFFVIDLLGCGLLGRLSRLRRAKNLYQMLHQFLPRHQDLGFREHHREEFLEAYGGSKAEGARWSRWVDRVGGLKGRRI